jgi:hypothetical protein
MKNYTETNIKENFTAFLELLKKQFSGDRLNKLLNMYSEEELGYRCATAPASSKEYLYNCYPGGYLDHIIGVCKASFGVKKLWEAIGCTIDFTDEELAFAALHCNLGKLGDKTGEYYLPQDNDWLVKNRNELFKINPLLQHMTISDRSLMTLQTYDIKCTDKEYLAIKLCDGMYNESNKTYLQSFNIDNDLKTNLPHIIHAANHLACRAEIDIWKRENV